MKHILTFSLLLLCQAIESMEQQERRLQPRRACTETQNTSKAIEISHFLGVLPTTYWNYNSNQVTIPEDGIKQRYSKNKFLLPLGEKKNHKVRLFLPTSPNYVWFNVKPENTNNNGIHAGDKIVLKDNLKSIIIINKTTNARIVSLPKEGSSFRLGKKVLGKQLAKTFTVHNVNIPFIHVTMTDYQLPIMMQGKHVQIHVKKSKFLCSHAMSLAQNEKTGLIAMSTDDDDEKKVDATLKLSIDGALQNVTIRSSCEDLLDNDTIFIKKIDNGYIVLFKVLDQQPQILARLFTKGMEMQIPMQVHHVANTTVSQPHLHSMT